MRIIVFKFIQNLSLSTGKFLKQWYAVFMEKIEALFSFKPKEEYKNIKSERSLLIYDLVNGINKTRPCTYVKDGEKKTLGKITARAVANLIGHLKEERDIQYLLDQCRHAKNFSSTFFYLIKVRK